MMDQYLQQKTHKNSYSIFKPPTLGREKREREGKLISLPTMGELPSPSDMPPSPPPPALRPLISQPPLLSPPLPPPPDHHDNHHVFPSHFFPVWILLKVVDLLFEAGVDACRVRGVCQAS